MWSVMMPRFDDCPTFPGGSRLSPQLVIVAAAAKCSAQRRFDAKVQNSRESE
jgi:hypothetical protein